MKFANTMLMLAQASNPVAGPNGQPPVAGKESVPDQFFGGLPIDQIWDFIVNISWLQAVVSVAFGLIYLTYGWRVFKILVIINFAGLGLAVGLFVGNELGSILWGGILGTVLMAIVSWPFMKYSVSVLGACAGAVLGAALWRTITLPEQLIWCGALAGLISGGFLAFSSFKVSIMLFTSLQGSVFIVIGILALLNDYPNLDARLTNAVYSHGFLLPALVIFPTAVGIYLQIY